MEEKERNPYKGKRRHKGEGVEDKERNYEKGKRRHKRESKP